MDPIEDYAREMLKLVRQMFSNLAYSGVENYRRDWYTRNPQRTPYTAGEILDQAKLLWLVRPQPNPLAWLQGWLHSMKLPDATCVLDAILWHIELVRKKGIPTPPRSADEMEAVRQCLLAYANSIRPPSPTAATPTRRRRSKSPDS
jgi:hypothetical protein